MKRLYLVIGTLVLFLAATATMGFGANWILESKSGNLPGDLETTVSAAGGTLVKTMDEVGIAVAEFATREEAEAMEAYGFDVMPDVEINWLPGADFQATEEHIGLDETFYGFQWHLPAIKADLAWDEGYTGAGARVAIVDSGIWYLHPDLAGNIDFAAGATFVPGTVDFMDDRGHGTHVAGIVAAIDNDWGSIGVAPSATLIPVKVLASNGKGNWSWIVAGIIHAANQNVDIINLSLGGTLRKSGNMPYYNGSDVAALVNTIKKALHYAKSQGCLVISSAGNDYRDLNHDWNYIKIPAQAGNGVIVSATGPYNQQDFDRPASYTNFGTSAITVAAPGGDFLYSGPNWWWDMVFSTTINGWSWMAGTSMAAPVASGVAALIVGKYGSMKPDHLEHKLVKSADDLGKPGTDEYYGKGRVNAYEAVK
jgi:subtilisin family serine protease